jgi:hypothetical protein
VPDAVEDYRPAKILGLMAPRCSSRPRRRSGRAGAEPAGGISVTFVGHSTVLVRIDGVTLLTDPCTRRG